MPRMVRTGRGEMVDFDAILIKQQLAQAPMNIEVARRKEFIDAKEGKPRGQKSTTIEEDQNSQEPLRSNVEQAPIDFEIESEPVGKIQPLEEPVPIIPDRKK